MKWFVLILAVLSIHARSDVTGQFGSGTAKQVINGGGTGLFTNRVEFDLRVDVASTVNGLNGVVGYDFICDGDSVPNRWQIKDNSGGRSLRMAVPDAEPLFFQQWPASQSRGCTLNYSAEAVGSQTTSGLEIVSQVIGAFSTISFSILSGSTSPAFHKGIKGNSRFTMVREVPRNSGGGVCD